MAQTTAERQAAYRARHLHDEDGTGQRLNVIINMNAKLALERLASCYGVTQLAMLEQIIETAQREVLKKAARLPNGQNDYFDGKLRVKTRTRNLGA